MDHHRSAQASTRLRRRPGHWAAMVAMSCLLAVDSISAVRAQEPVLLPAGAQFVDAPESLPDRFPSRGAGLVAGQDGTVVVLGAASAGGTQLGDAIVAVRTPDGAWTTETVDDLHDYRPPRGESLSYGFMPVAIAAGPSGYVAIGRATFYSRCGQRCRGGGRQDAQVQSLIWTSPDGRSWKRIDPRDVLGRKTSIALQAVMATADGGWMVAGSTATLDLRHPSRIVVLTSPDGIDWKPADAIAGSRSLEALALHDVGGVPLLAGVELACSQDGVHHSLASGSWGSTIGGVAQLRLWRADPTGRDWQPVDTGSTGLIKTPPRASISRRDCATTDYQAIARMSGTGSVLGAANGRVVALADLTHVSVSLDLEHWTVAELPGSIPGDATTTDRGIVALSVMRGPDDSLLLLSLEARRDPATDSVLGGAHQVITWRTDDDGASWQRLPATRPMYLGSVGAPAWVHAAATLKVVGDGQVALTTQEQGQAGGTLRLSEAAALLPWGTCEPTAGADCSFSNLDLDLPGADLTGIDLSGAWVGYGDWSGVNLRGANMRGASVNASLVGADLDGASAGGSVLWGDTTGALVRGADLRNAYVDLAILSGDTTGTRVTGTSFRVPAQLPDGVSLSGRDLTAASFTGSTDPGDLIDIDFGDAHLDGASFSHVDLTGAKLKHAPFESLSFFDVTCPDGKPMTEGVYGLDACRIKAR